MWTTFCEKLHEIYSVNHSERESFLERKWNQLGAMCHSMDTLSYETFSWGYMQNPNNFERD